MTDPDLLPDMVLTTLGAAEALRQTLGAAMELHRRAEHAHVLGTMRTALGDAACDATD